MKRQQTVMRPPGLNARLQSINHLGTGGRHRKHIDVNWSKTDCPIPLGPFDHKLVICTVKGETKGVPFARLHVLKDE